MKGSSDEVKALAYKAKNRTQELLSDAKTIELKNPQDKYFRVLAEVWIDGESLGEKLKSDGLAKEYDGKGLAGVVRELSIYSRLNDRKLTI